MGTDYLGGMCGFASPSTATLINEERLRSGGGCGATRAGASPSSEPFRFSPAQWKQMEQEGIWHEKKRWVDSYAAWRYARGLPRLQGGADDVLHAQWTNDRRLAVERFEAAVKSLAGNEPEVVDVLRLGNTPWDHMQPNHGISTLIVVNSDLPHNGASHPERVARYRWLSAELPLRGKIYVMTQREFEFEKRLARGFFHTSTSLLTP